MKPARVQAFTLAETLFAMAIVSFTLLAIIGIIPSSLSELNDAERRAAEARILQSITNEYELKSWDDLTNSASQNVLYFSGTGILQTSLNDQTQYAALVEPMRGESPQGQPGQVLLPGEGNAGDYLRCLRVAITNRPHDSLAFANDNKGNRHRNYAVVIANREPDLP